MYRTELEPLPLNTRAPHHVWMLVVAVVSFSAGAATMEYVDRRAPATARSATLETAATPLPAAPANEVWRPPVPATSSVYHGRPGGIPATALTATATRGCVWAPPVPATSSVYSADCNVLTTVPQP